jgi:DNA-binding MarR family transcriptional regulator
MSDHTRPDAADADVAEVVTAVLTASRLLVAVAARSLASVGETLTLPQFRALVVLAENGAVNLSGLAASLGVNPSTAMRMVDRLESIGMVARTGNPENRREVILRLSDAGRRTVDDVTERRRAEIAAIVAKLPADQRIGLVTALRAFTDAGGEPQVEDLSADQLLPGWH